MSTNLRVPGALPVPPLRFVETPVTRAINAAVEIAISTNTFGAISGPPGVGKTTTSAVGATLDGGPVVYVHISSRVSAKQNFVNMFEAVSGTPAQGSASQIQADLHDHLIIYPTTMLIDDAHLVGRDGLILIKGLFDLIATTRGEGTPIILVGNSLMQNLALLPELVSRINGQANARYLQPSEVVDAVRVLEPRTRNNDQNMLFDLDRAYFKGELRRWSLFFKNLNTIGGHSLTEPYSQRDIKEALIRMDSHMKKETKG